MSQSSPPLSLGVSPSSNPPLSVLPAEKVFSIQIGSQIFRLSGASIMSDAPSYFSQYFESQLRKCGSSGSGSVSGSGGGGGGGGGGVTPTLYIDRDPETFAEIARHLQGYHIQPQDGLQYARLFADAQFYSLPRLTAQLFENDILIEIGYQNFRIPRSLLTHPKNSPNYFTHSIALSFASTTQVFPGLERNGLLRPPCILPLHIDNRDPNIFMDLMRMLNGYEVHIRDEEHRSALLKDCRYYQFKGLEQRLIPHNISYNIVRRKEEITIKLGHVKQPGLKFVRNDGDGDALAWSEWLHYSRPNTDDQAYELIVQIDGGELILDTSNMRLIPHGQLRAKMKRFVDTVKRRYADTTGVKGDIKGEGLSATSSPAPMPMPMSASAAAAATTPLQSDQQQSPITPSYIAQNSALPLQFPAQFARETTITLDGIHPGQERWNADFGISPSAAAMPLAPASTSAATATALAPAPAPVLAPTPSYAPVSAPGSAVPPTTSVQQQQGVSSVPTIASASSSALNHTMKRPRPADLEADTTSNSGSTTPKKIALRSNPSNQQLQQLLQQQTAPGQLQLGVLSPSSTGTAAPVSAGAAMQPMAERTNRVIAKPRGPWIVNNSQWRVRVRLVMNNGASSSGGGSSNGIPSNSQQQQQQQQQASVAGNGDKVEVVFMAVKVEAYSGERGRNRQRKFL